MLTLFFCMYILYTSRTVHPFVHPGLLSALPPLENSLKEHFCVHIFDFTIYLSVAQSRHQTFWSNWPTFQFRIATGGETWVSLAMIQRSAASSRIVLSVQTQRRCIRSKAQTGALLSPKKNINRVVHQEFIPQNCQQGSLLSCPWSVWGHKQHTCTNSCMCVGTLSQLIWTSYVFLVTQTHYSITMWLLVRFGSLQLRIIPKMKFKLKALTAHVQNSCVFSPIDSGVQNA